MHATEPLARGTPATEAPLPATLAAALAAGLVAPAAGNGQAATPAEQAELVAAFKHAMAGNPPDHPTLAVLQENPRALVPAGAFDASTPRAPGQRAAGDTASPSAASGALRFSILNDPAASRLAPAPLFAASDRLDRGAAHPAAKDHALSGNLAPNPTLAPDNPLDPAARRSAGPAIDPEASSPDSDRRAASSARTASTDTDTLGAAVLQSMLAQGLAAAGQSLAPAPAAATAAVNATARLEKLEQVVAETVSRVLVSDPLHDGNREVRVEFARDVLPDTSVRLWRDAGRLHVEFSSTTVIADSGLRDGLPRLAAAIQRQDLMVEAPVVSLRLDSQAGQPGDGRSRQQYYPTLDENGELA